MVSAFDAEVDSEKEFEMQEQFASALVSRVRPQTSLVRAEKASVGPLLLSVYPNLLKAESLVEECMISDVQDAIVKFGEVAKIAPSYARPFCGIARCYAWMALHGGHQSREWIAHAKAAAETALRLDPEMMDAHTSMGTVQALKWQWEGAETSLRKAAAHRSDAAGSRQLAMLLTQLGHFDEACVYLDGAQRIDPFSSLQKVARLRFLYLSRRHGEALKTFVEPLQHGPIPLEAELYLALIHAALGKYEEATGIVRQAQRSVGVDSPSLAIIAEIYARCGDRAKAELFIEDFGLVAAETDLSKSRQARLAAALEQNDLAVELLYASYSEKEPELPFISVDPGFDTIRRKPAFSELLNQLLLQKSAAVSSSFTVI